MTDVEVAAAQPVARRAETDGPTGIEWVRASPVDAVGLEGRAAALAGRSLKRASKLAALDLAVRCTDFTTLEGADTPGKVVQLCAKARRPDPQDPTIPPVAAVCVYPALVAVAARELSGSGVKVASVAGSFPAGLGPLTARLEEIGWAVNQGADEVDIVLDRCAFLSGRYGAAFDEIAASKQAAGSAHLKVILETGELGSYDQVRRASALAMAAGADFIKTSTGKISTSATLPVALCMAEAIREHHAATGVTVGLKVAGGIRTAKQAWQYLVVVSETLGAAWMTPDRLRLGASSLLNDLLLQIRKERTGRYQSGDDVTND
jgi:deoxyribose-phosphate aldolase